MNIIYSFISVLSFSGTLVLTTNWVVTLRTELLMNIYFSLFFIRFASKLKYRYFVEGNRHWKKSEFLQL